MPLAETGNCRGFPARNGIFLLPREERPAFLKKSSKNPRLSWL
jgi:hypothetical protein